MPDTLEKTPGVYVRTGEYQPHELDMLWSGTRYLGKEDRSPLIFMLVGFVLGVVLSCIVFFLFFNHPQAPTGDTPLTAPIESEKALTEPVPEQSPEQAQNQAEKQSQEQSRNPEATPSARETQGKSGDILSLDKLFPVKQPEKPSKSEGTALPKADRYTVQDGDTLERVARRYYGSGTPEMIEKIRRANRMESADNLQIGQVLVIPPRSY